MDRLTSNEVQQVGGGDATGVTPVDVGLAQPYPYPYPWYPSGIPAFGPVPLDTVE